VDFRVGDYCYWGEPKHRVKVVSLEPLRPHLRVDCALITVLLISSVNGFRSNTNNNANVNSLSLIPDTELLALRLTGQLS
jgi:hypothetical protein